MTAAGKWKDEDPEELEKLRAAVRQWRAENPEGTEGEMVKALAPGFRDDWEPVLRANWGWTSPQVAAGISIITGQTGE